VLYLVRDGFRKNIQPAARPQGRLRSVSSSSTQRRLVGTSGRLVGELSVLIKRRHPEVQAEIHRVYQEHLAQLSKRRGDPAALDD
jgi:hypothetical protein